MDNYLHGHACIPEHHNTQTLPRQTEIIDCLDRTKIKSRSPKDDPSIWLGGSLGIVLMIRNGRSAGQFSLHVPFSIQSADLPLEA